MRKDGDEFIFDPDTRRLANEARGSNGSCDDLLEAVLAVWAGRAPGVKKVARSFVIFPGSGGVGQQIERPDP